MTDASTLGTLPRYARDIAVTSAPNDGAATGVRTLGVLEPFSGVLNGGVERGRPPLPDLSYLTLAPLVAAAHARSDRGDTGSSRRSLGSRAEDVDAGSDDDPEPTVRDVLRSVDTGASTTAGADAAAASPDRPSRVDHYTDDATAPGAPDRPVPDDGGGATRDAGRRSTTDTHSVATPAPPTLTAVDRTAGREVTDRGSRDTSGRDGPTSGVRSGGGSSTSGVRSGGGSSTPGVRSGGAGIAPPTMTVTAPADDDGGERERQWAPGRRESGGPGDGDDGPRLTLRTAMGSETAAAGEGQAGSSGSSDGGDDAGSSDGGSGSAATTRTPGRDDGGLSAVLAASANPESRLVDRLYRAIQERDAIERRRRGGR